MALFYFFVGDKLKKIANKEFIECLHCGKSIQVPKDAYRTGSVFYNLSGYIPCCKECLESIFREYCRIYSTKYSSPFRKAMQKICMTFDLFFSDDIFEKATQDSQSRNISVLASYFKIINLVQYKNKKYDDSILSPEIIAKEPEESELVIPQETIDFFGKGFPSDAYAFLQKEYDDWVARNECETKQQEEIFKNICFKQWELQQARLHGDDTTALDKSFRDYLETAGLQPKQKGQSVLEQKQYGAWIGHIENDRPVPEPSPEFKDVDYIGTYVNTFGTYQLAKMHGLHIQNEEKYEKILREYTVEKPKEEYGEDGKSIFDAIFGESGSE